MTRHLRSFAGGLAVAVLVFLCPPAGGQDPNLRQFDPSDVYFQAWLKIRDAERSVDAGEFLKAYNYYDKAANLFDSVAIYHPEWKTHLVKDRQESTRKSMDGISEKALAEQEEAEKKVEGLVEGPGTPMPAPTANHGIKPLTPNERQNLAALQRQIRELRDDLNRATSERDANAAQLRRALAELEAQRDRMARAPLQGQVRQLTEQLDKLQQERDAMATALQDSRGEHQRALADIATLSADKANGRKRVAELENNLNIQRQAANEVVKALRSQLKELKDTLEQKDQLLAVAKQRSTALDRQLRESHAEIADLREERNALLRERDHMAALLALNETDRVKLLIEQNMKLGKQLNEARENLQKVVADNNNTAKEIIEAKHDLAFAKGRILQLNRERDQQEKRLNSLEDRLRNERNTLAETSGKPSTDARTREEITILQGIINRQLKVQDRRRQSKELLVARAKALAIEDEAFGDALAGLNDDLKLTPEEHRLVQENTVDGEFIWGDHPSKKERAIAGEELQEHIRVKTSLARRAFSNDRFLVAREFFESILEEHPGHVPTWLNLGVVLLRNQDPLLAIQAFNDALTIREDVPLPYAQFMLGVSYYELLDFEQARNYFKVAVELNPTNAKAFVFLGSIAGVCDPSGQVLGLMPHPERYQYSWQHPLWSRDHHQVENTGLQLFKNAIDCLKKA